MDMPMLGILAAAVVAILYGVVSIGWIMKLPAGNARMHEIAKHTQVELMCGVLNQPEVCLCLYPTETRITLGDGIDGQVVMQDRR